jgi:hypothetical protein
MGANGAAFTREGGGQINAAACRPQIDRAPGHRPKLLSATDRPHATARTDSIFATSTRMRVFVALKTSVFRFTQGGLSFPLTVKVQLA